MTYHSLRALRKSRKPLMPSFMHMVAKAHAWAKTKPPATIPSFMYDSYRFRPVEIRTGKAARYDSLLPTNIKSANLPILLSFGPFWPLAFARFLSLGQKRNCEPWEAEKFFALSHVLSQSTTRKTRRDSVARRSRPTTQLELTGVARHQSSVKEWE